MMKKFVVTIEEVEFDENIGDFDLDTERSNESVSVEERLSALLAISLRERFDLSDVETKTVYYTALRNIRKRDWDWLSAKDCQKEFLDFRKHIYGAFRQVRTVEDGDRYSIVETVSFEMFMDTIYSDNYRDYMKDVKKIIG